MRPTLRVEVCGRSSRLAQAVRVVFDAIAFEFPQECWPRDPQDARSLTLVVARSREGLFDRRTLDVAQSKRSSVPQASHVARATFL